MSIFDRLPTVNKCCFCINLKWGTVIIAILGIFSFGIGAVGPLTRPCPKDPHGLFAKLIKFFAYIVVVIQIVLIITSIILIVGIIMRKPKTATWFMVSAAVAAFLLLISGILLVVNGFVNSECPFPIGDIVFSFVAFLVWMYFIAVVKSYRSEM